MSDAGRPRPTSSPIEVRTQDASGTRALAAGLATCLRPGDMIVLDGPLGAGKTTFTQGLGEALGVRGPVASPTFVIARVHPNLRGGPELVHVDAYRLGDVFDIDDLDLDSDLDQAITVVEWGRDLVEHLTDSHLLIELRRPGAGESPAGADDAAGGAESADPADGTEEPRSLRVLPVGPRWDDAAVSALADALTGPPAPGIPAGSPSRSTVDDGTATETGPGDGTAGGDR
jgi:tRNA threonylcarbamoyladenosine biosynthesis protein TsaE